MSFVEARELAHEIVEAPRHRRQFTQREHTKRAGRARPQKQRQMREVAALREGRDHIGHGSALARGPKENARRESPRRALYSVVSAHPRENGDPVLSLWIPACAGMSGSCQLRYGLLLVLAAGGGLLQLRLELLGLLQMLLQGR